MIKRDNNHRGINCETCKPNDGPTVLQAWISEPLLEDEGYSTIAEIDDDELRRLARINSRDCAIEGDCYPCNGPDDGDDGNQDD